MGARYHILVCNSFRLNGTPQGVCFRKGSGSLLQALEQEIGDRGLDAIVTGAGCLKRCDKGPVMAIYPPGWWYGGVDEAALGPILDALEADRPDAERLLP